MTMAKKIQTLNSQAAQPQAVQHATPEELIASPVKRLAEIITLADIAAIIQEPTCEQALRYGTRMSISFLLADLIKSKECSRYLGQIKQYVMRPFPKEISAAAILNGLFNGPLGDLLLLFYSNGVAHEHLAVNYLKQEIEEARKESKEFSDELDKAIADVKQCVAEAEVQELNQRKAKAEAEAKKQ